MNTENKSTELDNTDKKLHISDVSDSIKSKPTECTICPNTNQDKITNILKGVETNGWFCLKCGGLIGWVR